MLNPSLSPVLGFLRQPRSLRRLPRTVIWRCLPQKSLCSCLTPAQRKTLSGTLTSVQVCKPVSMVSTQDSARSLRSGAMRTMIRTRRPISIRCKAPIATFRSSTETTLDSHSLTSYRSTTRRLKTLTHPTPTPSRCPSTYARAHSREDLPQSFFSIHQVSTIKKSQWKRSTFSR